MEGRREKEGERKREGERGRRDGGRKRWRENRRKEVREKTTYHCSINDVFDFLFVGRIFQNDCQKPSPSGTSKTTA